MLTKAEVKRRVMEILCEHPEGLSEGELHFRVFGERLSDREAELPDARRVIVATPWGKANAKAPTN